MSRIVGRIFIVALLSAAVAWGVWAFALQRPDMQMQLYARSAELRNQAARPKAALPGSFRAVACAAGPCVLVEAGGHTFLVGAGGDAAEGLWANGLMRGDITAILLTDLTARSVAGLPSLRDATRRAGRHTALSVYGPAGVDQVIAGANALLDAGGQAEPGVALAPGRDSEGLIYTNADLSVSSLPVAEGAGRLYRFDLAGRVLLVGGCSVTPSDLVAGSRGASAVYAVIPATSAKMMEIEQNAAQSAGRQAVLTDGPGQGCLPVEDVSKTMALARLNGAMLAPLYPAPKDAAAVRAWAVALAAPGAPVSAGAPGTALAIESKPGPARLEPAPTAPTPAATAAAPTIPSPTPAPTVGVEAPKPPVPIAPKPAPSVAVAAPTPKPSPAIASAPRARSTPKTIATSNPSPPNPEPAPAPTSKETGEPMPTPIFPLRSGIPQTDSPLRVGPRITPTPSPSRAQNP